MQVRYKIHQGRDGGSLLFEVFLLVVFLFFVFRLSTVRQWHRNHHFRNELTPEFLVLASNLADDSSRGIGYRGE